MFHIQSTKCVFIIADIIVFILANIYHVDAWTNVLSFFERHFQMRKSFVKKNENYYILIDISPKFIPGGPTESITIGLCNCLGANRS